VGREGAWAVKRSAAQTRRAAFSSQFELRFHVIARKVSGGHRSEAGRQAQQTLPSIIRTCRKLGREPYDFPRQTLCSPTPLPLAPTGGTVN
jgi:hypothetical protein